MPSLKSARRLPASSGLATAALAAVLTTGCAASDGAYPNLASVPAGKPQALDAEQRKATMDALAGDRGHGRAVADTVTSSPGPMVPALPPRGGGETAGRLALVEFGSGSTTLSAEARGQLAKAAAASRARDLSLRIVAHAVGGGPAVSGQAEDLALAARRADAVVAELTRLGVPRARLSAEARPAPAGDPAGDVAEIYLASAASPR